MLLRKSKLFSIVVCIITVLSLLSLMIPSKAGADSNDKSLTLVCISDDVVLSGMKWKLYKVGERTSNGRNFTQIGDFSAIQVNLRRLDEERVNEAAQTFKSYAVANQIPPLREGQTNENGEVEFTGLDSGLYLIFGTLLKIDTHYYVPTVALIEIKEDDQNLRYDAYPKFEYEVANEMPRRYTAYKKWTGDEEYINGRPSQIVVDIFKDEEYCDSVILNAENNWQYSWIDNYGTSSWIVMEKDIPAQYELNIKVDKSRFILENAYTDEPFTTTTVQSGETTATITTTVTTTGSVNDGSVTRTRTTAPTGNETFTMSGTTMTTTVPQGEGSVTRTRATSTSRNNDKVTTTARQTESGGKLPQTGQLWWPVVPLSIGGVLLVSAGLAVRSKKKSDD